MKNKKINLDNLQIAKPCSNDWESMAGDEKMRFCNECNKDVYNFAEMTRIETEALVRQTSGKVCARIIRDSDGSVVTAKANIGLKLVHLRASKWASAVVTAALSLSSTVASKPLQRNDSNFINLASQKTKEIESGSQNPDKNQLKSTATLKGTVFDIQNAVIVDAKVTLTNMKTREEFITKSSEDGIFQFVSLDSGLYELKVQSLGFVTFYRKLMPIQETENLPMNITLQVGATMGEIVYIGQPSTYVKFEEKVLQPFRFIGNILRKII